MKYNLYFHGCEIQLSIFSRLWNTAFLKYALYLINIFLYFITLYIIKLIIDNSNPETISLCINIAGLQIRVRIGKLFLYFSSKTYVVGTQKNRLNERVLLSTQNTCLNWWVRKQLQFYANKISLSGFMNIGCSSLGYIGFRSCSHIITHKAPPIICSRRQFQILPLYQK